jgi:hypothetical protein
MPTVVRTTIPVQRFQALEGQSVTYMAFDTINGMQCQNLGIQVALVRAGGGGMTVTIPSVADAFDRVGDIVTSIPAGEEMAFGPFTVPVNWGDGARQLFLDATGTGGTIAVIEVG